MGDEVVGAFRIARHSSVGGYTEALLHQPFGGGVAVPAIYILADGSQYLQTSGS